MARERFLRTLRELAGVPAMIAEAFRTTEYFGGAVRLLRVHTVARSPKEAKC